jgi:hypothetical protein
MSKHLTETELLQAIQLMGAPDSEWLGDPHTRRRFFEDLAEVLANYDGAAFNQSEDDMVDDLGETYSFGPTDSTPEGGGVLSLYDRDVFWLGQDNDPNGKLEIDIHNDDCKLYRMTMEVYHELQGGNEDFLKLLPSRRNKELLVSLTDRRGVPDDIEPELFAGVAPDGETVLALVAWVAPGSV